MTLCTKIATDFIVSSGTLMDWLKGSSAMEGFGPHVDDLNAKRMAFHAGPCWLKLLVADRVAGSIIGKGGKVITEIEASTGCVMKLSPGQTFFPGTQERIVVISGSVEGISEAVRIILVKVRMFVISEFRSRAGSSSALIPSGATSVAGSSSQQSPHFSSTQTSAYIDASGNSLPPFISDDTNVDISIRAVVPNSAVSCIIGRGGEVVKEINRNTGAMIRIGDRMTIVHERIVQITGTVDQCHGAVLEVLTRIQSDKNLREHLNVVYTKAAMQSNRPPPILAAAPTPTNAAAVVAAASASSPMMVSSINQVQTPSGPLPVNLFPEVMTNNTPAMYAQNCSISLTLPPGNVSTSLFRRIEAQTGTQIRFRQQTGSVHITGPFGNVHCAHILLLKETSAVSSSNSPHHSASDSPPSHIRTPPRLLADESTVATAATGHSPPTATPSPTNQMRILPGSAALGSGDDYSSEQ